MLRESATFDRAVIAAIQRAAETGVYDIRGWGAKRAVPHFDDLLFLGASLSRYPLEGYRERCGTDVVLGDRHALAPLHLDIPVTIAGMSFGSLSAQAKEALGRGASEAGTSTTTGDGGMTPEERGHSTTLVYQYLPSRYGMNPDDLRAADAIEVVLGQGAKPGGGGMLLGQKIDERVAAMRTLPAGIDQRSACRHPDWTGPDDLAIKILELREITDWRPPVFVKVGATRTYYDVKLAVAAGADVVVVDGMQGGTAATQEVFIEHVGIPTLAAIPQAVQALQELGLHRKVQLIVSGGIRTGADVAKAMALGADAVSIGTAALIALGDNAPRYAAEYRALGSDAGFYDDFQDGRDPAGITTQDPELAARLDPVAGGRRVANYLRVLTLEAQTLARACGKAHLRNLEPEDLVAADGRGGRDGPGTAGGHELGAGDMKRSCQLHEARECDECARRAGPGRRGDPRARHRRAGAPPPPRPRDDRRRARGARRDLQGDAVEDREQLDVVQPHDARPARRRAGRAGDGAVPGRGRRRPRGGVHPGRRRRADRRPGQPGRPRVHAARRRCAVRTSGWRPTSSRSPSAARSSRCSSTPAPSCCSCWRARWSTGTARPPTPSARATRCSSTVRACTARRSCSRCRSGSCRSWPTATPGSRRRAAFHVKRTRLSCTQ